VIAPGLGPTNVIGMNFLSRLESLRLEGNSMILVPHNPSQHSSRVDPARCAATLRR
jgi:aspartyl protease family protein